MPDACPSANLPADPATLYDALVRRDAAFEGLFFACVRTTGIFCRPTCTARKPRPENVEYVATPQEALLAGYRPCRVCHPLDLPADAPAWLDDLVTDVRHADAPPIRERQLRDRGLDPDHVRRQFKRHYGMSLSAFQRAVRLSAAMRQIRDGTPPGSAALDAGYNSESGFRDAFTRVFGLPPSDAARAEYLSADWLTTPLGPMLAVASDRGLCLLEFVDRRSIETQVQAVRTRTGRPVLPARHPVLDQTRAELEAYHAGSLRRFTVPLDPQGTAFERASWDRLLQIPYAEVCSYSAMARDLGKPGAARAVGRANGANRIAIIIPCHRVIRADGSLCGYGGGIHRKRWLLDHERGHAGLFDPDGPPQPDPSPRAG